MRLPEQLIDQTVKALLLLAAKAHHWHLTTQSYSAHKALGHLYEEAHDCADRISEAAQGAGFVPKSSNEDVVMMFTAPENAIRETEQICQVLAMLDDASKGVAWLSNIVQDCHGKIYAILYRLKRLK